VFFDAVSEGGNDGALLYRTGAVTAAPALMHIAVGDGSVGKHGYAIEFPIVVPEVQFTPLRAVDADGATLTWEVPPTDNLRFARLTGELPDAITVTAQVLPKQLPGCDYDNVVKLSRDYSCGRGGGCRCAA
jgi:hypothetical protein